MDNSVHAYRETLVAQLTELQRLLETERESSAVATAALAAELAQSEAAREAEAQGFQPSWRLEQLDARQCAPAELRARPRAHIERGFHLAIRSARRPRGKRPAPLRGTPVSEDPAGDDAQRGAVRRPRHACAGQVRPHNGRSHVPSTSTRLRLRQAEGPRRRHPTAAAPRRAARPNPRARGTAPNSSAAS